MSKPLDVYYGLHSPWSFLAWDRLKAMTVKAGVEVRYHPVDLGTIFAATGGVPLVKRAPERQRYRLQELARWTKRVGLLLNIQPRFFPVNDAEAAHLVLAARDQGHDPWPLSRAFMAACWQQERNIADPATQDAILKEQGLDPAALRAVIPAMTDLRHRETQDAIAQGVFGAPFFVYGETRLWGQDRLTFLAEELGVPEMA